MTITTLAALAVSLASSAVAHAHGGHMHMMGGLAVNPELGVHGWPDCVQPNGPSDDVEANQLSMVCHQRGKGTTALKVACVGDSITAGAHSSGANMTYPAQLQRLVDPTGTKVAITNLGACGSTLQKEGDSPYWQRPQYGALVNNTWDVVVIMLGTNDAKDKADGGPPNWLGDCNSAAPFTNMSLANCRYGDSYADLIAVVRKLGTTPAGPQIFVAIPPPLMQRDSIGANQTVINNVYPALIPLIARANNLTTTPIDVFGAMGGVPNWQQLFPPAGCQLNTTTWPACSWWCDEQSCDECHPNDTGYTHLAATMRVGLGL